MFAFKRLALAKGSACRLARLCPRGRLILPFAAWLLSISSCASSADHKNEALRELASLNTPGGQSCRPGSQSRCFDGPDQAFGRGICRAGERVCSPEGFWGPCKHQVLPMAQERCNGQDDDCNGVIDDGFPRVGSTCSRGKGECLRQGVYRCGPQGTRAQCSAPKLAPREEICDGKDNDCDGEIDEAGTQKVGEACSSGRPGPCAEGRFHCQRGRLSCVPRRSPTHEICNRIDDDCNGHVDDNCSPR